MSYGEQNPYQVSSSGYAPIVAQADTWERTQFIKRTYLHLAAAIGAFALIEAFIFTAFGDTVARFAVSALTGYTWLLVLGAFLVVSWIANAWASHATSPGIQYFGLGLYVVAQAVIFVPLLYMANTFAPGAIGSAAALTGIIFGGLTMVVMLTKKDFSFLRNILWLGSLAALGFIVCAILFNPDGNMLGPLFATAMIVLMAGYILYYTSNVLHHYRTTQHVAAALALFASIATLFWYVLILFMNRD